MRFCLLQNNLTLLEGVEEKVKEEEEVVDE